MEDTPEVTVVQPQQISVTKSTDVAAVKREEKKQKKRSYPLPVDVVVQACQEFPLQQIAKQKKVVWAGHTSVDLTDNPRFSGNPIFKVQSQWERYVKASAESLGKVVDEERELKHISEQRRKKNEAKLAKTKIRARDQRIDSERKLAARLKEHPNL